MKKKMGIGIAALVLIATLAGGLGNSEVNTTESTDVQIAASTFMPTAIPTQEPTAEPTQAPTLKPTLKPTSEPTITPISSKLEIHFIDVGQGDATLIMCDGEAMLIDAGDNDKGTQVQLYLSKRDIKELKYVIGTHPDADHIGGLDVVLYKFKCDTLIMPEISADTDTYRDVITTMNAKSISNTLPNVGDVYELGNATFTIVGPVDTYSDRNDNSVSILLEHGENTFLFTGDAQEDAEADIVDLDINIDADVYKVGHHGSDTSSSLSLLNEVTPEYAVISCAEGNSYGHPHAEVLNNLRMNGVKLFRTDEQGSIVVTSDGKTLTWNCSPTDSWQAGERTGSAASQEPSRSNNESNQNADGQNVQTVSITYVLNKNTKKFHVSTCRYVGEMADHNKIISNDSRDSIIANNYVPCKVCKP